LGSVPDVIYLAFAAYATPNNGALIASAQVPPSVNGDGHVDAGEYAAFALRVLGDLNCDGVVNFGDINPFVLYLSNFASWQAAYPGCNPRNGDINGDGTYGQGAFGDINPFVALLTNGP
jgi:hypothetical protein